MEERKGNSNNPDKMSLKTKVPRTRVNSEDYVKIWGRMKGRVVSGKKKRNKNFRDLRIPPVSFPNAEFLISSRRRVGKKNE